MKRLKEYLRGGRLTLSLCGNGVLDKGEECEDGNRVSDDGCSNRCRLECGAEECWPRCGDGIITAGEECDRGPLNNNTLPNACRTNCKNPRCGDSVTDAGEQCDEGPDMSFLLPNTCRPGCGLPTCGDGIADNEYGEQCDGSTDCLGNCQNPPPPPCACDEKGCRPNPDPWSDPHYGQCTGYDSPWTRTIGTTGLADYVNGFAVDSNGTIYVLFTSHTVAGVTGFTRYGEQDMVLQKRDSCGNLVWERVISSAFAVNIDHLAVDVCGNSYIAINDGGILVRKYNFRGDVVWEDRSDGYGHEASVAVDSPRNVVYVTSSYPLVEESNRLGTYVGYAWIRKYDAEDGSILWTLDDELVEVGQSARVAADTDGSGNLYTILNESPFVLTRLDPSGNVDWSTPLSGYLYKMLAVGPLGEIFLTRKGMSFFSDGPSGEILKYASTDGSLLDSYVIPLVNSYGHRASGIAIDADNNILATGVDFDNVATDVAEDYYWLMNLGPTFDTRWTDSVSMPLPALNLYSRTSLVAADPAGTVYVGATVTTTESGGLDGQDVMLRKYSPSGEITGSPEPVSGP